MTNQEIRDEFKKLVIMGNHPECDTYEEALEKDQGKWNLVSAGKINPKNFSEYPIMQRGPVQPITIGRVMNALPDEYGFISNGKLTRSSLDEFLPCISATWTLQTPEGREATDDDQDIETIKALLEEIRYE